MKKLLALLAVLPAAHALANEEKDISAMYNTSAGYSVSAGYIHTDAKFKGDDETNAVLGKQEDKYKGFFVNAAYNGLGISSIFVEYAKQSLKDSSYDAFAAQAGISYDADLDEITIGLSKNIFENQYIYMFAGAGVGYAKLDQKSQEVDANYRYEDSYKNSYVTLPLHFEVGYKVHPLASVFANVGYKWAFNVTNKYCESETNLSTGAVASECYNADDYYEDYDAYREDAETLDFSGASYKIGVRFHF